MLRNLGFAVTCAVLTCGLSQVNGQQPQTPGPEHKALAKMIGTWDCEIKSPDGQNVSKGESVYKAGPGGLWVIADFKGMMGPLEFQGHGIDGYDQGKKKYVSVWTDSMTSAPMFFEGDYDDDKKTLTLIGEGQGPDGQSAKFKSVTKFKDEDHHTFTLNVVGPGGVDIPMMSIDYTRRK